MFIFDPINNKKTACSGSFVIDPKIVILPESGARRSGHHTHRHHAQHHFLADHKIGHQSFLGLLRKVYSRFTMLSRQSGSTSVFKGQQAPFRPALVHARYSPTNWHIRSAGNPHRTSRRKFPAAKPHSLSPGSGWPSHRTTTRTI